MRDYAETIKNLRETAKGLLFDAMPYRASVMKDAADAIEELLAERDKALNRLCEFCGVCSEKSRSPFECEIAGFEEPPKGVE